MDRKALLAVHAHFWRDKRNHARRMVRARAMLYSQAHKLAWWRWRRAHPYIVPERYVITRDWLDARAVAHTAVNLLRWGEWGDVLTHGYDRGRLSTSNHYGVGADRPPDAM